MRQRQRIPQLTAQTAILIPSAFPSLPCTGSLDNCREGFLEGLKEEGIEEGKNLTVDYKNAEAAMDVANQIAQGFVSDGVDLICAIATPSAQSAYNAAMNADIPVIYTAITDPVAAELAKEDKSSVGNVTGNQR